MNDDPIQPGYQPLPFPGEVRPFPDARDPYRPPSNPKSAKGRLMIPGIFTILVGLLNLIPGMGCIAFGYGMDSIPDAEMEQMVKQQNPQNWDEMQKEGYNARSLKNIYFYSGVGVGVAALFLGLLALVGGGCMIAGRGYFLCVLGALAAILSPGGFGLLGLAIGIWGIAVLLSEEVRSAFRAPPLAPGAGGLHR